MISGLTPISQELLNSINITQRDLNTAQSEVSSGLRISQASDDPRAIGDLLQTRSDLARLTQVQSNLNTVQTEAQTADGSLQTAVQLLQQAGVLATQGANSITTPAERASLATQINGLLAQMVGISQTQVNGQYIFSGDQTGTPPYELTSTGIQQLVTAPSTRLIQDPTGLTFGASLTAQQIFDARDASGNPTSGNVFASLQSLATALSANDQAGIQSAASAVNSAQSYLNQQTTFYGDVENRISTALDLAQKFQTQDQTSLSSLQDADVAAEALQITQDTTQLSAALSSAAKLPSQSLFQYLPPS